MHIDLLLDKIKAHECCVMELLHASYVTEQAGLFLPSMRTTDEARQQLKLQAFCQLQTRRKTSESHPCDRDIKA